MRVKQTAKTTMKNVLKGKQCVEFTITVPSTNISALLSTITLTPAHSVYVIYAIQIYLYGGLWVSESISVWWEHA
jgi:hypothetical protein